MHFIDTITGIECLQIVKMGSNISAIEYSPRDTYLITCEKYSPGAGGSTGEKNLLVYNTQNGKEVVGFVWKKASKEGPRSVKLT